MPEELLANAAITDMQMRQRDVAALDAKYTKELADAAENDAWRDDVAAGRRRLHYRKQSAGPVQPPLPPAWIMQPPPTGRHRCEFDYFTLRERLINCAKQLEGTQKYINEQADRASIRWATHVIIAGVIHNTLPAEYKCLK